MFMIMKWFIEMPIRMKLRHITHVLHREGYETMTQQGSISAMHQAEFERQWDVLTAGVAEVVPLDEFKQKLLHAIVSQTPLRVKLGLDPSAPDLHIGHTVVLHKLRQFQQLGHRVQLIIGDFTGRIGDPTGKSATRKPLTPEDVVRNAQTYKAQLGKIIDIENAHIVYNSQWLAQMTFADVVSLSAKTTVARMLERDDFQKRYTSGQAIALHEFFYPLMQGYDSVQLGSDVELGGTDQKFNLLMGRMLQREYGKDTQVALMMPLLTGIDGVQKMSKSLHNAIGISESPQDIYGKTMRIGDEQLSSYMELVTSMTAEEVTHTVQLVATGKLHPRDAKMQLAFLLVSMYYSTEVAQQAQADFVAMFQQRTLPETMPTYVVPQDVLCADGTVLLTKLLVVSGLQPSVSEAKRTIAGGGIKYNEIKITDPGHTLVIASGDTLQVGRRHFRRLIRTPY
jgi:tyrosyl-tRNA synthetase